MKKIIVYFTSVLVFCAIAVTTWTAYNYYAPPKERTPYQTAKHDDTIRIAYIGDSWAFMHKNHDCQIANILEDTIHRPIKVHSYGICGLTSKEIYENILDNSDFKSFFQKRGYDYCYISAGINDTYKKLSTSYYQNSMDGIIRFLLANNIHPIIQEIPDYNISKAYTKQKIKNKILRHLSMIVNNTPLDCKQQFRDALDELITEKDYQDKVSIIRYKSWNHDYANDLIHLYVNDQMHLNEKGYHILDSVIAYKIHIHYKNITKSN